MTTPILEMTTPLTKMATQRMATFQLNFDAIEFKSKVKSYNVKKNYEV